MKKIIIFGATGEVGEYVTEYLNSFFSGIFEIVAVGRRKTDYFDRYNVRYVSVDVINKRGFEELPMNEVYAVVDFAAVLPARMSYYDPSLFIDMNIKGTYNVLEYTRQVGAECFIFTKSVSDYYGYLTGDDILYDDMPVKYKYTGDHTIYAISKCAASDIAEHYHQMYGIRSFIFRLPNVYCYHPDKTYYVDGKSCYISYRYMIDLAIHGKDIELWGNPIKGRDVLYVKDLAQVVQKALESSIDGGTFNVGSGKLTSMEEQIKGIISVFSPLKSNHRVIYRPEKRDCINYLMDITKAQYKLGYEPQYSYIDYLEDYKNEMRSTRFVGM